MKNGLLLFTSQKGVLLNGGISPRENGVVCFSSSTVVVTDVVVSGTVVVSVIDVVVVVVIAERVSFSVSDVMITLWFEDVDVFNCM